MEIRGGKTMTMEGSIGIKVWIMEEPISSHKSEGGNKVVARFV